MDDQLTEPDQARRDAAAAAVLVFAYGSNLSSARLRRRAPSAQALTTARLDGYRLAFHKPGLDGSAKCDALYTGAHSDTVHGVVYRIDPADKPALDTAESLGVGYAEHCVEVISPQGEWIRAGIYLALQIQPGLRPFDWYREHLLRGAREHGLSPAVVRGLSAVPCVVDPDTERRSRELAIYRGP